MASGCQIRMKSFLLLLCMDENYGFEPSDRGRKGSMYDGLWLQDSDEILAPAEAGMIILASRSVAIEPSYRGRRGYVLWPLGAIFG